MNFIIASVVNFVVMIGVLYKYGRKPFLTFLQNRSQRVADFLQAADKDYTESQEELTNWNAKWDGAEQDAKEHETGAYASIHKLRENTLAAAKEQSVRILEEGKLLAKGERKRVRERLTLEIVSLSVGAAARQLDHSLGETENGQLTTKFLEQVHGQ